MKAKSIFSGYEQLVCDAFQLDMEEFLKQKDTWRGLSESNLTENAIFDLIKDIYHRIEVNVGVDIAVNKSDRLPREVRSDLNW